MNLCVIPARGGSKRIPRKNIREFCGKPMIAWSIEAAKASSCFDHVIVSTDDQEIAQISESYGAEIPFIRPNELSTDLIGTIPVIHHAVEWSNKNIGVVRAVCCLYPTAPFVEAEDLRKGLKALLESGADYAFSVTRYGHPIQRAIRITSKGRIQMLEPLNFNRRSQDLQEAWHDAGQFYWGKAQAWLDQKPLFTEDSVPVVLPRHAAQDIDTMEDWKMVEMLFMAKHIKLSGQQADHTKITR